MSDSKQEDSIDKELWGEDDTGTKIAIEDRKDIPMIEGDKEKEKRFRDWRETLQKILPKIQPDSPCLVNFKVKVVKALYAFPQRRIAVLKEFFNYAYKLHFTQFILDRGTIELSMTTASGKDRSFKTKRLEWTPHGEPIVKSVKCDRGDLGLFMLCMFISIYFQYKTRQDKVKRLTFEEIKIDGEVISPEQEEQLFKWVDIATEQKTRDQRSKRTREESQSDSEAMEEKDSADEKKKKHRKHKRASSEEEEEEQRIPKERIKHSHDRTDEEEEEEDEDRPRHRHRHSHESRRSKQNMVFDHEKYLLDLKKVHKALGIIIREVDEIS